MEPGHLAPAEKEMRMSTAKVYYLKLTDEQRTEINDGGGWASPVGRAYQAPKFAKEGEEAKAVKQACAFGLYEAAAEIDGDDPEAVWMALQNLHDPWTATIKPLTDFPRSMDVGDLIVWDDGRIEMVASVGFRPVEFPGLQKLLEEMDTHPCPV